MQLKACLLLCLALLLLLGLAEGWVRHFDSLQPEPGVLARGENGGVPLRDVPLGDALKELPQLLRGKRQSASPFPPTIHGDHQFSDGYRRALIHYSGDNSKVIFVLTYNSEGNNPTMTNLYRSADYGASFSLIDSLLDTSSASPEIDPLLWPFFYVNPANRNILIFPHATEGKFFYTQDEGASWNTRTFTPSSINPRSLLWNPKNSHWAIAHDSANNHLYVTINDGDTFTKIADNVHLSDYQWTDADSEPDQDISVVYYNTFDPKDQNIGDFTEALCTQRYPYTDAMRREFDPALGKHDDFLLVGPYIFAQQTVDDVITLLVSHNRKPFKMAKIPSTEEHRNYIVTHLNQLQALVIVEHENDQFNLYLSGLEGILFSLSLPDLVVQYGVGMDLEVIEGINGTMIANQNVRLTDPPSKRTLRTLDNGGVWEFVSPPDRNLDGQPITCSPPSCSLHFHMTNSEYARTGVYSQDSAPGIIIAHGTIGQTASDDPDLYISRDGGVSWDQTLDSSWGVTVADHGGLIVAAKDYHTDPSQSLKYSCNEGASWQDFEFSVDTMTIYGLITEPGEHTTIVSLYGIKTNSNPIRWDVVTVNFTAIFSYTCQTADYYYWEPWDDRTEEDCILGSEVVIERRRPERCCLNGNEYDRVISVQPCACTEDDFDCDYGYMRADGFSGPCVRDPAVNLASPCLKDNTTSYMKSSGYRKIPGDVCTDGVSGEFNPQLVPCCESPTNTPPPTGSSDKTPSSMATSGGSTAPITGGSGSHVTAVALGVLFAVAVLVAIAFAIALAIYMWKSKARRNYQPVATARGGRFEFSSSPDQSVGLSAPTDDDDDAPIMP